MQTPFRIRGSLARAAALVLFSVVVGGVPARAEETPVGTPAAVVDLRTHDGVQLVGADWRFHEARVTEVDFHSVGPDRKPTGPMNRTYDYEPHAGARDFDDSGWESLDPTSLEDRRSSGKVCFAWYRLRVRLPERVEQFALRGATVVFSITVDDYAEVWVNGELPRTLGQRGGSVIAGWNTPNRVALTQDARPGDEFQIAVFGINGPISDSPSNYIWIRAATLEVYPATIPRLALGARGGEIERIDPAIDRLLPAGTQVEKLTDGLGFAEGPVWTLDGALLFSDPNTNVIYRWSEAGGTSLFRARSGYSGEDVGRYRQPGSNGLAFDPEGRLTICQHGNRRVTRLEADGSETVLVDRYQGKRLNSPNDLVYRSDGTLYFTDPYFGLPGLANDPARETPWSGLYCWKNGKLALLDDSLDGPNGLAFSPDERYLYVGNWDAAKKWVVRYDVAVDGSLRNRRVFFDLTQASGEEAIDGLKVDREGNVYVSGPGGLSIVSPKGRLLGRIVAPELPANFAWGDADGRGLYLTARTGLYRVRTAVPGAAFVGSRQLLGAVQTSSR